MFRWLPIGLLVACLPMLSEEAALREEGEEYSGGQATVFDTTPDAFSRPAPGLDDDQELLFFVGDSFFEQNWVTAPASAAARDGLGPFFNSRSCAGCHLKDGRGRPPTTTDRHSTGLLLRLSRPGRDLYGRSLSDLRYGHQLQDRAVAGILPEARAQIRYRKIEGTFADGTAYTLLQPQYALAAPAYGAPHDELLVSPRVANQMIGLGLLEAVPEADLLARSDPNDADGDGVSGRPNYVWDAFNGRRALGRFGWKANQPHLLQQVAAAFVADMGITSALFPVEECTDAQAECRAQPTGGAPEISSDDLHKVVLYASALAVPARRDWDDPQVLAGKRLFRTLGCATCHVPVQQTGIHPTIPALSHQRIRPYTDLLLHDMGEGLADGRPDFEASGREWRTPPLWGIGLFETVNGHTRYLHDGRARNLMEAVLWHGGEAEQAKERVLRLTAAERRALLSFLESLGAMWMGWGCALLVLASCSGEGVRSGFDRRAMLEHTATTVILPLHQELVARAAELTEAGDRFVRSPTVAALGEVQDRWRHAAVAWKRCALFEIGSVQDAFIHYSIYKRPTNVEFIEGYLDGDQVFDADFVETLGSTAKGLPAIEYLVFDAADDDARVLALFQDGSRGVRRRQYLQALTRNLQRKTEELLAIWTAEGQDFAAAFARSDGEGLQPQGSIALLTNEMIRSIESILQFRLSKPLGFSGQGVQPDLVEARLSRYSLPLLRVNIEAFALAFSGGHGEALGLDDYVDYLDRPYGDEALLSARIKAQTAAVLATIDSFDKSLYETIAEDPTPARQLFAQVRQLLVLVKVNMANVLGVTVTFNALDGD